MPGVPVVIVESGGAPVIAVESGAPVLTVATNNKGVAITIVTARGAPFVVEGYTP